MTTTRTNLMNGKEGIVTAAKLISDYLLNILMGTIVCELVSCWDAKNEDGVTANTKLKMYDLDFGFWKQKKHETVSIDYQYEWISIRRPI
ncbi:hypothetical protein Tco_0442538 [Tanacetum coccineum]